MDTKTKNHNKNNNNNKYTEITLKKINFKS